MDFETVVTTFNLERPHTFLSTHMELKLTSFNQSYLQKQLQILKIIVDIEEKEKLENTKVYKLLFEFVKLTF